MKRESRIENAAQGVVEGLISAPGGVGSGGFCGNYLYTLPNGYRWGIFWDCGDLDYTDKIICPNGEEVDFDDLYPEEGDCLEPLSIVPPEHLRKLNEGPKAVRY